MDLPNPSTTDRMSYKFNFKQSKARLDSEFSFSLAGFSKKIKEASQPYYLPGAEGG